MAARAGHALAPQPGLARARRLPRRRPRQLGAALPHHLGHGPRRGGALRAPGARGGRARPGGAPISSSRGRVARAPTAPSPACAAGCWRPARSSAASRATARRSTTSSSSARGGDRHHRRHRRQPRAGAREVAEAAGRAAEADALRRARPRGRADAGDRQGGRRQRDQRRPHVALRRGPAQLGPDLAHARDPDHPRAVVAVVRRRGRAAARPALSRLRHARHPRPHPAHGLRLHVVRPDGEDHREGVRAVGLRAEPRHHLQEPAARCSRSG